MDKKIKALIEKYSDNEALLIQLVVTAFARFNHLELGNGYLSAFVDAENDELEADIELLAAQCTIENVISLFELAIPDAEKTANGACERKKDTVIRMETSLGNIRLKLYDETVLHRDNILKLIREGYYNGMLFHRVIKDFMIQTGDPDSKSARPGMVLGANDIGYTLKAEIVPKYFHKRGVLAAAREADNINPERSSSGSHFYIVQGRIFTPDIIDEEIEKINNKRYTALFNRLQQACEGEILKYQLANDYEKLMQLNEKLSDTTRLLFDQVKLKLTGEQRAAYTTIGGSPHLDGEYTVFGEVIEGMEIVDSIAEQETDDNCRPLRDVVILKIEEE